MYINHFMYAARVYNLCWVIEINYCVTKIVCTQLYYKNTIIKFVKNQDTTTSVPVSGLYSEIEFQKYCILLSPIRSIRCLECELGQTLTIQGP